MVRVGADAFWRETLAKHPHLALSFQQGLDSEEVRKVCQQNSKLEQAIFHHGLPSSALCSEFAGTACLTVWQQALSKHPGLLDLLLPGAGSEQQLHEARRKNKSLDELFVKYGAPPPQLLKQPASRTEGPNWSVAAQMPFDEQHALSKEELSTFFSDGYLHIKGAVPQELVNAALKHINHCIGQGVVDRSIPIPTMVGLPPQESQAGAVLDLFRGSRLPTLVQSLLGRGKVRAPGQAQIAARFPAAGPAPARGPGGRSWHVDGFHQGTHSPFTLLVGVCLSDVPSRGSGNFAVHPGAHWGMQDAVRQHVAENMEYFSDVSAVEAALKPDLGPPRELLMERGDVVLAHQKLPHLGVANHSPDVRYQVYFRVVHVAHEVLKDRWLDDLLLPFEGVREAMPDA